MTHTIRYTVPYIAIAADQSVAAHSAPASSDTYRTILAVASTAAAASASTWFIDSRGRRRLLGRLIMRPSRRRPHYAFHPVRRLSVCLLTQKRKTILTAGSPTPGTTDWQSNLEVERFKIMVTEAEM